MIQTGMRRNVIYIFIILCGNKYNCVPHVFAKVIVLRGMTWEGRIKYVGSKKCLQNICLKT